MHEIVRGETMCDNLKQFIKDGVKSPTKCTMMFGRFEGFGEGMRKHVFGSLAYIFKTNHLTYQAMAAEHFQPNDFFTSECAVRAAMNSVIDALVKLGVPERSVCVVKHFSSLIYGFEITLENHPKFSDIVNTWSKILEKNPTKAHKKLIVYLERFLPLVGYRGYFV